MASNTNRKRTQVHMLPTNGKDIAMLSKRVKDGMLQSANGTEGVANCNTMWQPQHLYFTSDEEIKEGDWFINTNFQKIYQANSENSKNIIEFGPHPEIRKIIASTDPKLETSDEVFHNTYKQKLPQPSQAFIKAYCEQGGIDEVDVEYELNVITSLELIHGDKMRAEESDFQPKTDSNNCIIIHPVEEKMYSKEELLGLTMGNSNIIDWINENL